MEIIGLSGKSGTGKDYIASHFFASLGFKNFSLAWPCKIAILGQGLATYEEVFETKPSHIRKLLQTNAEQEKLNTKNDNIWINITCEWITLLNKHWGIDKFVIPDVRFPYEIDGIRALGGKIIRIQAPKRVAKSILTPVQREHISETALDNYTEFDGYIFNDPGHSDTLYKQLQALELFDMPDIIDDPEGESFFFTPLKTLWTNIVR